MMHNIQDDPLKQRIDAHFPEMSEASRTRFYYSEAARREAKRRAKAEASTQQHDAQGGMYNVRLNQFPSR